MEWFRAQHRDVIIYSIPNGGSRHQKEVKRIKAEGVLSGVSDLFVMKAARGFNGLYIEMKYGSNTLSDNQRDFLKKARKEGYAVAVCYTLDEFMRVTNGYLRKK